MRPNELKELRFAFDLFDVNGTGFIDVKELKTIMVSLAQQSKDQLAYHIIESLPDGKVSFDQFVELMTAKSSAISSRDDLYQVSC